MSRSSALIKAFKALTKRYKSGRSFSGGTRVQGAARSAAGKAQSVASASAGRGMAVPTLSTSARNALKIGRRYTAAQQGVHYKKAVMPDYYHSMHRVRRKAIGAYGSTPNPIGPIARKSSKRKVKRRRSR